MDFLDKAFSKKLITTFKNERSLVLGNPYPELDPLIVSAVFRSRKNDLTWMVNEKADKNELRAVLKLWLEFFNLKTDVNIFQFPSEDPYFNDLVSEAYVDETVSILKNTGNRTAKIIITTPLAMKIPVIDPEEFRLNSIEVSVGDTIGRDRFIHRLSDSGYHFENWLDNPGEFSKRGGIVEVFPPGAGHPVRVEFFGNRVETITGFDRNRRNTVEELRSVYIPDCKLTGSGLKFSDLLSRRKIKSPEEILNDNDVIISEPAGIEDYYNDFIDKFKKIYDLNREFVDIPGPEKLFGKFSKISKSIDIERRYSEIDDEFELKKLRKNLMEMTTEDLHELKKKSRAGWKIFIMSGNSALKENLNSAGVWIAGSGRVIPNSFLNKDLLTIFLCEKSFRYKEIDRKFNEDIFDEISVRSFKEGEFIVHSLHGIGIFRGTSIIDIAGREQEFVKIEFSGKEFLYVPVYDLDLISRYESFKAVTPRLDKMGGKSFSQKKIRAKKSITLFAKELLDLYARRQTVEGYSYYGDPEMEGKLAESFPFIETPDQARVISEVFADLGKGYPMERLVCGDVSFGKTEVAIRASLRVVLGGKQVAVLCPTTILAIQHLKTFTSRLSGLPVNISMLSRLVTGKRRSKVLKDVADGTCDILIGTHALLSSKLNFKNLGLYIIDEEQRFGVFQKERLKKERDDVDVLTLSATPIPRTLSMSFAGLQDISVIRTPPEGRLSIKNRIDYFSREKVVSAVLNETRRGGAVFIVYNSIEKIFTLKKNIESWIPEIKLGVIHAKMPGREIERTMTAFIKREFSVLLSTTIIENGIDISHVNTLAVINAEKFGLTQLYQLRGRIGRGSKQAYAYFFIKKGRISEKASLRLEGIRDHSKIGSGFELAELDLKLRGAGALLGNKQHGHVEALGFEFYNKLLKRTVDELKGVKREEKRVKIETDFKYNLDSNYIESNSERIDLYTEISNAGSLSDLESLKKRVESTRGPGGDRLSRLFYVGKAKYIASLLGCKSIRIRLNSMEARFDSDNSHSFLRNKSFADKYKIEYSTPETVVFRFSDPDNFMRELEKIIQKTTLT